MSKLFETLMTVDEVAQMLAIAPNTVWRHARNGHLPRPIKIAGATRWRRTEIEAVIEKAAAASDTASAA